MAETTADVRRDIELTRERMTSTLAELERKLNLTQIVKDNPWPAIGLAVGAGLLLSGSRADVKAAGATSAATHGLGSRLAPALDDIVANLMAGLGAALQQQVDVLIDQVKASIGVPPGQGAYGAYPQRQGFAGNVAGGAHGGGYSAGAASHYGDATGIGGGSPLGTHVGPPGGGPYAGPSDGPATAAGRVGDAHAGASQSLGSSGAGGTWSPHTAEVTRSGEGASNLASNAGTPPLRGD